MTLDVRKTAPVVGPEFKLSVGNVMQSAVRADDGTWFVSQAIGSNPESIRINHCAANGALIGYSTFTGAGHGTVIDVQRRSDGKQYIWTSWPSGTTPGLVRVRYVENTTVARTDSTVTEVDSFSSYYTLAALDCENDQVVYAKSYGGNYVCTLRKLSDVEAGLNNPIGTNVSISTTSVGLAGFGLSEGIMYWATGSSVNPWRVLAYDMMTGIQCYDANLTSMNLGKESTGSFLDNYLEPEGICVDKFYGDLALWVGYVVGGSGARRYRTYAFTEGNKGAAMTGKIEELSTQAYIEPNWMGRPAPAAVDKIALLRQPGWYYLDTATFGRMTDAPSGAPTSSGYWLEVAPTDPNGTFVLQQLTFNRGKLGTAIWVRRSSINGADEFWTRMQGTWETSFR